MEERRERQVEMVALSPHCEAEETVAWWAAKQVSSLLGAAMAAVEERARVVRAVVRRIVARFGGDQRMICVDLSGRSGGLAGRRRR